MSEASLARARKWLRRPLVLQGTEKITTTTLLATQAEPLEASLAALLDAHVQEVARERDALLERARGVIDKLMGDSDLNDDNSEEMQVMQAIDAALRGRGVGDEAASVGPRETGSAPGPGGEGYQAPSASPSPLLRTQRDWCGRCLRHVDSLENHVCWSADPNKQHCNCPECRPVRVSPERLVKVREAIASLCLAVDELESRA